MRAKIAKVTNTDLTIFLHRDLLQHIKNTGAKELEIKIVDPRSLSDEQRKKTYALLNDIAEWQGEPLEWVKSEQKYRFLESRNNLKDWFSLSNCSMTIAKEFIEYLINFCIVQEIATSEPLSTYCMDNDTLYKYVYWCVENRTCAVTGRKGADIHEVEAVGMGRNRNKIHHLNQQVLPLCREKHTEAHQIGFSKFMSRYHLTPIRLDRYLCGVLGWKE